MKKRTVSLILALAMVVTMLPVALAANDSMGDVAGHWGESSISRWVDCGVAEGLSDGEFGPDVIMTRAQIARLFVKLLGLKQKADLSEFGDLDSSDEYYDDFALCVAAGIFTGDGSGKLLPDGEVSREQLFTTFARALGVQPVDKSAIEFTDGDQVADWSAGYVAALVEMGAVSGPGDGSVLPKQEIDRASVMAVLDKAVTVYANEPGATVTAESGIVLVAAESVTVTGAASNLVVTPGSSATLDKAEVKTATVVGEGATLAVGSGSSVGSLVVEEKAVGASVTVAEDAKVETMEVAAPQAAVTVNGTVSTIEVADTASSTQVKVEESATVSTVESKADNVTIGGDGKVENAVVTGNNTAVNTEGTNLTVAPGASGVTENDKPVTGNTTTTPEINTPGENTGTVTPPSYTPVYYYVYFYNTDGEIIGMESVVAGSTVTAPTSGNNYPAVAAGEQLVWYNGSEPYSFTGGVYSALNLTAVVGSNKFASGNGTAAYPYCIATAEQFYAIGSVSSDSTINYKLTADISVSVQVTPNGWFSAAVAFLQDAVLDGNNKTITTTSGENFLQNALFYQVQESTIKNLKVATGGTLSCYCDNSTFDNVDVTGSFTTSSNVGVYMLYAWPFNTATNTTTLNFINCDADVDMVGAGDAYSAVFVGYAAGQDANKNPRYENLNFTNCTNTGSLVCGMASMFLGNAPNAGAHPTITVNNCSNNGLIQATSISPDDATKYADGRIYSHFISMNAAFGTVVLDGTTHTGAATAATTSQLTCGAGGSFVHGPKDASLALTKNGDSTYTIAASSDASVSYYVVTLGIYARYGEDHSGTVLFTVSERIESSAFSGGTATTTLKHLSFVDDTFIAAHSGGQTGTLAGNAVYTLNGTTYYKMTRSEDATLLGVAYAPRMVNVSAYAADGTLLASASLSN